MKSRISAHLESTPDVCGGKPRISGTRITVKDVVLMHLKAGRTLAEIAGIYDLPMSALHEAMAYYYDHRQEIEALIEEDEAYVEALRKQNPSLLQQLLPTSNA